MEDDAKKVMEDTLGISLDFDVLGGIEPVGSPTSPEVETPEVEDVPKAVAETPLEEELPDAVKKTLSKYGNDPNKLAQSYNELYGKFQEGQTELNKIKPLKPLLDAFNEDVFLQRKVLDHIQGVDQAPVVEHPETAPLARGVRNPPPAHFMPKGEDFDPYDAFSDPDSASAKAYEASLEYRDRQKVIVQDQRERSRKIASSYKEEKQKILDGGMTEEQFADFEKWASTPSNVTVSNLHKLYSIKDTIHKVESNTRESVLSNIRKNASIPSSVASIPADADEPELTDEDQFIRDLVTGGNKRSLADLLG